MSRKYTMPQFREALMKLGDDMRGKVLEKAALAGGMVIEGAAKININDTFNQPTGNLKNSITTRVVKSDSDSVTVHVGPSDVEYGRIQELGGVIKPVKAKRLHWVDEEGRHLSALAVTIPARPYLRPAVDDNVSEITGAVGENLRIEIEGAV